MVQAGQRQRKGKGTRLYRFETTARYGSSATYGYVLSILTKPVILRYYFSYKILDVKDGSNGKSVTGKSVLQKEEFAINQRYRSRPRAYLMSLKPITYSEVAWLMVLRTNNKLYIVGRR